MRATRARDIGITVGEVPPGPLNAITDVPGVRVGHTTLIEGDGDLEVGTGPVRTGVTIIEPRPTVWHSPVYAGAHRLNGNGELTGLEWIRENGQLTTPIGLTNTHSVGVVRDAIIRRISHERPGDELYFHLPVVGETYDGFLNDVNGQHVTADHVFAAFDDLSEGPVAEGSVGGGTGMICHEFKGGIGTSSRVIRRPEHEYTLGVLVQANHGRRGRFRVNGVPVGERIPASVVDSPFSGRHRRAAGTGSIIVVIATDAPLLPHQCRRLAQRGALAIGRTGGSGENSSGDLLLAFSTGNDALAPVTLGVAVPDEIAVRSVSDQVIDALFDAVIDATEEAIVNAVLAGETMSGRDGVTAHGLDPDLLVATLHAH